MNYEGGGKPGTRGKQPQRGKARDAQHAQCRYSVRVQHRVLTERTSLVEFDYRRRCREVAIPFNIRARVVNNGKALFSSNTIPNVFVGGHMIGASFRPLLPPRCVSFSNTEGAAPSFLQDTSPRGDLDIAAEMQHLVGMCPKTNNSP